MDTIHRISRRLWINQEPVNIRQFIESCQRQSSRIEERSGLNETIETLEQSLNRLATCTSTDCIDDVLDTALDKSESHANLYSPRGAALASSIKSQNEAVISIRFLKSKVKVQNANRPSIVIQPEYDVEVLSSQLLSDLRPTIRCENSAAIQYTDEKTIISEKSGFFFIENTFYNDTSEESVDYSRVILEWAKNSITGIDQMQSTSLENVKFNDLTVRLGYPYLYRHMGDCEHLLVFQSLRMWNPLIDQNAFSTYPRIPWTLSRYQEKCFFCSVNVAKCKVSGHPELPSTSVSLCQECLQLFCPNKESLPPCVVIEPYLDQSVLFS